MTAQIISGPRPSPLGFLKEAAKSGVVLQLDIDGDGVRISYIACKGGDERAFWLSRVEATADQAWRVEYIARVLNLFDIESPIDTRIERSLRVDTRRVVLA